jgi:hypothetical protein
MAAEIRARQIEPREFLLACFQDALALVAQTYVVVQYAVAVDRDRNQPR